VKRREFITLVGGAAAAWPGVGRAQQAMLVVGFLNPTLPHTNADRLRAFHRGLKDTGYVEGENLAVEYRWAEGQFHRLPELATDLVRRQVSVIATTGGPSAALAAKGATTRIPIVFAVALDPIILGLVTRLNRPEANLTGISILNTELTAKRLALLRELVPKAVRVAVLVNPTSAVNTEATLRETEAAARAIGIQIQVRNANTTLEIDAAFESFSRDRPDALFVGNDGFFVTNRTQLSNLASRHAIPAAYASREIAEVGGLMSYGTSIVDSFYQTGVYTGRILNGAKPADLPVVQSSKFELVINLKTARALGLTVPQTLQVAADEVIE
jgi:putative tryptophan/tyrosine transport system substrate-binding protein